MPTFCGSCGAPITGTGKFCGSCGAAIASATDAANAPTEPGIPAAGPEAVPSAPMQTPIVTTPSSTPAATPAYTAAPTTGGGSALKIILIILGVLVFLGLLGMGSCMYVAYRAKQKFNAAVGEVEPYRGKKDPCALVTMSEVGAALGQPVTGMGPAGTSACVYNFGNGQQMAIETTWEGGAMTMSMTHGAMKQISGMETFTKVEGIGDEAYIAPMGSMLMMRKGDVMVNIDMRVAGLNVDAAKQIAKKIAGRL